jgi:hypothetical protein
MPTQTRTVAPGPTDRTVRTADGQVLAVPPDWVLIPPGDPGLTRRVKAAGPTWTVQEKRGRKLFGRGVWTAPGPVAAIRLALEAERADPAYAKKQAAAAARRDREQTAYVGEFRDAVLAYLAFAPPHATLAERMATAVAEHATPVGSGTVARTERIPVEERAEAAVIAWMRHQTTAYDNMKIERVKGKRREVRRMLAQQSKALLNAYRAGRAVDPAACPLQRALAKAPVSPQGERPR